MNMNANPYAAPSADLHGARADGGGGELSDAVVDALTKTRPWVRVVGVFLWIGVGLMVVAGLGTLAWAGFAPSDPTSPARTAGMFMGLGVLYAVLAALYVYPALLLWRYGSAIERVGQSRSEPDLYDALDAQRAFWKVVGIGFLALLGLYGLAFVGAMVFGVMSAV